MTMLAINRFESFTWEATADNTRSSSPVMPVKRSASVDQSAPIMAMAEPQIVPTIAAPVFKLNP